MDLHAAKHMLLDREFGRIKWVIIKVPLVSVTEIEYKIVKPSIHFWLLTIHYEQFVASIPSFITIT